MWIETKSKSASGFLPEDSPGVEAGCGLKHAGMLQQLAGAFDSPGVEAGCGLKRINVTAEKSANEIHPVLKPGVD